MREQLEVIKELVKGEKKEGGVLSTGEFIARLRQIGPIEPWTQEELAEACGVSARTVRNWEKDGKVSSDKLSKLFEALGITWKEFQERRILLDLSQGQNRLSNRLLMYKDVLNPTDIWKELQKQRRELDGMLKVIDEKLKDIDMNRCKEHNVETVEISEYEKLVDLAWELDQYACCEYVINRSYESEQDFADIFYKDGEEYNPEIGLEVDRMDEEAIKAELVFNDDCSEENGIGMSLECVKQLLEGGHLSERAIEELKDSVAKTLQAVERQEITLEVEALENLIGVDLALSCFSDSAD